MKRLLRLLARLYPARWQARYGAEFDALLEDRSLCTSDLFDVLLGALKMQMTTWSFTRITLGSCLAGLFGAFVISYAVPSHYVSATLIAASPRADAATVGGVNQNANITMLRYLIDLQPNVLNRDSLSRMIQRQNLYPRERTYMPLNAVIDKMERSISIRPVESQIPIRLTGSTDRRSPTMFSVQFDYPDAGIAKRVDEELVSLLMGAALAHAQSSPYSVLRAFDGPNLPQKPAFPNRGMFCVVGLFTGLVGGLMLASITQSRRRSLSANDR